MTNNRLQKITVFRGKDSVEQFSAIFDTPTEPLQKISYSSNGINVECLIKYCEVGGHKKTEKDYPWISMINSLDESLDYKFSNENRTPSAVLGIRIINKNAQSKFFLLTFGMHTSRFINNDKLVSDFGIKIAMNICDQNKLRKVNTTTHSSVSTLTDRQASKGASLDIFDINDEKEFFRSISGLTYDDYPFIKSFSGKNSISINLKKDASIDNDVLVDILMRLESAYSLDDYKSKFPTYGRLDYVSDTDQKLSLDNELFKCLKNKSLSKIHLSPSEITSDVEFYSYVDPETVNEFEQFDDIDINALLENNSKFNSRSSIKTVKSWRVYFKTSSDEIHSLRAYDCINFEIEMNGTTYVLNSGIWRSINSDFKLEVENYIDGNIHSREDDFLPNDVSIKCTVKEKGKNVIKYKEEVYNSFAALNDENLFLFDKSKINVAGSKKYEICDLFHLNKELIHVKVLKGGSSSLSHLFLQARFYTDAFIKDISTRISMRNFIENNSNKENESKDIDGFLSKIPENRTELHDSSYSVIICILTFSEEKELSSLPFMVRYELAKTHKYLKEERGIELSYALRKVNKG